MSTSEENETYTNFSFAIMAIFADYVFGVSTQIGTQRNRLRASSFWSKDETKLTEALSQVRKASFTAVTVSLLIITATAITISLTSRNLEQRMAYILEGLSLLFSAVVFGQLSFRVATWTGLYYKVWQETEEKSRSIKELKFRARWSYYKIFGRFYFFLMPFYQGVAPFTIPASMLAGIAAGLVVDAGVYWARRKEKWLKPIVITMIALLVLVSGIILSDGVYFIHSVWGDDENAEDDEAVWVFVSFGVCVVIEALFHIVRSRISRKKFEAEATEQGSSMSPSIASRPRMATSLIAEAYFNKSEEADLKAVNDQAGKSSGEANYSSGIAQDSEPDPELTDSKAKASFQDVNEEDEEVDDNDSIPGQDDSKAPVTESSQDVSDEEGQNDKDEKEQDYDESPSWKQMFCSSWTCFGCVRGNDRTRSEKAWYFGWWTIYIVLVLFSLWLVIVNWGATSQQDAAREKLPFVFEALYKNINEGPVCAFDNKGADSNITTFANKEAANAEGFLVLHCGECAACSDWENLRQEYATREFLAAESARCAKKSLFGGRQAVLDCLKLEPISFQGKCAECWVDDILCTKGFCSFIFLQSTMINAVGDFSVGEDTITSAACEEAHCEAANPGDFVYCSGATRRRMNVTSTIDRPGSQRCGIVEVDWAMLFPEGQ